MYLVLTNISVQQIPTEAYPNRNLLIEIPYLCDYSGKSSWDSMVSGMKITIPKNKKYKAKNLKTGQLYALSSINKPIGGYVFAGSDTLASLNPPPTFLRGDYITFNIGWRTKLANGKEITYMTGGADPTGVYPFNLVSSIPQGIPNLFKGFISRVNPQLPFTIECEDMMWLLRYVPTPNKQWGTTGSNITLQEISKTILADAYKPNSDGSDSILTKYKKVAGINLTVSDFSSTDLVFNVRNFITQRGTMHGMLGRIKSQYKLDSYFRDTELRIGVTHYISSDAKEHQFKFQKNIFDGHNLAFKRKDDVTLSVIVKTHYEVETGKPTKDSQKATKKQSTEILVYNTAGIFSYITKQKGVEFPANEVGKRFTLNIQTTETNPDILFKWGVRYLKKYYYDGLQGSFVTYGIPYVKHGDVVSLTNSVLPEMNGKYMVKEVEYYGGVNEGLRQRITIDYKINTIDDIETFLF